MQTGIRPLTAPAGVGVAAGAVHRLRRPGSSVRANRALPLTLTPTLAHGKLAGNVQWLYYWP